MERALEQWKSKEVARLLALVETERRYYQEMVANLPISVAVLNSQCNLLAANRAFQQNFGGVPIEDLRKRRIDQIFPSAELQARIDSVFESGVGSRPLVVERALPGGGRQRVRVSVQAIRDWDEESGPQALLVVEDLADAAAEVQLLSSAVPPAGVAAPAALVSAEPGDKFLDPLPCVLWIAQAAGRRFTLVSPSAHAMLDIDPEEWIKTPTSFADRIHGEDRARTIAFYDQALSVAGLHSSEFRMRRRGVWYRETILVEAGVSTITGVITDITARRTLEEQLLQAQRLDAVSQLAGRLAHDINNPLMIVNGYAEDLVEAYLPSDPRAADVREIQLAGKRIGELTDHLQSVIRKQAVVSGQVDVATELGNVVERMRSAAGEYLLAEYTPSEQPLTVFANSGQLAAILLELAAALVEGGGETAHLTLSANSHRVSESVRTDQPLAPGNYVELSIVNYTDTAPHLPSRMFESLIPGKEPGREAGPVLARSFKTVQDWGGTIMAMPNANEIRVYLKSVQEQPFEPLETPEPAPAAPTPTPTPTPAPAPAPKTVASARKISILIAEDETGIRALMRKILEREGFEVYEAASGAEALKILKQKGPVNLLITDVIMPGMTGRELATLVKVTDPYCAILHMSGFTADTKVETGQFPPGSHFLQKPFTLGSLLRKVNEVLASAPRRPV